jgi:hypothetical protein
VGNERALRVAAQHETEMLTGELTQRMQVVTTQVSDRVERLMDMPVGDSTAAVEGTSGKTRSSRRPTPRARSRASDARSRGRAPCRSRTSLRSLVARHDSHRRDRSTHDRGTGRRGARRGRDAAQQRRGARAGQTRWRRAESSAGDHGEGNASVAAGAAGWFAGGPRARTGPR